MSKRPPEMNGVAEWLREGDLDAAERRCREVLERDPGHPWATHLLGMAVCRRGDATGGLALLRKAARLAPGVYEFHNNLGAVCGRLGLLSDAADALRAAVALRPDGADGHANLAHALDQVGQLAGAEAAARRAIELRPGHAEAWATLGSVYRKVGALARSREAYERALASKPAFAAAAAGLAVTYEAIGLIEPAIAAYRRALELDPGNFAAHSSLLFALHYDGRATPASIYAEHLAWAARHAARFYPAPDAPRHGNDPNPHRRVRVGYVSADLRFHIVGRLLLPLLRCHDRSRVEVYCYFDGRSPDDYTRRLRACADVWRETAGLSDAELADLIRGDRIDVLLDPHAHVAANRLRTFARRPAPVQVTHFGYPNTTGLATMDWRFTDAASEPPGAADALNVESLYRLPDCAWCYLPDDPVPDPKPRPPMAEEWRVTFGCLNKLVKVSDACARVWCDVLRAVPGARLLLLADGGREDHAAFLDERFVRHGVDPARVELVIKRPHAGYLALHNAIDVVLDPFPFNGDNTTCDALWCGVPVVTLAGDAFVSRRGVSHLSAIGLTDLIAHTPAEYVATSVALARDPGRLTDLRATLRGRMRGSVLCDAAAFARGVETAYRHMWGRWCARGQLGS